MLSCIASFKAEILIFGHLSKPKCFAALILSFIGSGVNDCGGAVNDGTSGHDSKEDSRCFAPSEDCDHCDKKDGRNDED
jgi:hypothetical protein